MGLELGATGDLWRCPTCDEGTTDFSYPATPAP